MKYECEPWQAPWGGKDCDKCGKDGRPCTKYRCQSLGQACEFFDNGDQNLCLSSKNDGMSPRIVPLDDAKSENIRYKDRY